jgi:hypothetical protein
MTDERKAEIRKQIEDLVIDTIDNMSDSEMIDLWNEYCGDNGYYYDRIEHFDEGVFNDLMAGKTPYEIYQIIDNNDISFFDDYCRYDGYELNTFSDVYDSIDINDLVEWIIEEEKDLCNFDIDELYNKLNDEDEE